MNKDDYPALYRAADSASDKAQANFFRLNKIQFAILIGGTAFGMVGVTSTSSAEIAALIFLCGIGISLLIAFTRHEATWYKCRAIAESAKTVVWRFVTRAEPYNSDDQALCVQRLTTALRKILNEHRDLATALSGTVASEDQITLEMTRIRNATLEVRRSTYLSQRIDEQQSWYASKSSENAFQAKLWIGILLLLQSLAVALVVLRIAKPTFQFWPVEVFVVAAAGALTWLQTKRFRELAAAYALSAHEIGLIKAEAASDHSEEAFSRFVGDAENAFSREHTQWIARKDESP